MIQTWIIIVSLPHCLGINVPMVTNSILLPELQIITETEPQNQPLRNDKTEEQRSTKVTLTHPSRGLTF